MKQSIEKSETGVDFVTGVKKLYLDTERIVYRLYLREGMVDLGAKAP